MGNVDKDNSSQERDMLDVEACVYPQVLSTLSAVRRPGAGITKSDRRTSASCARYNPAVMLEC